MASFRERLAAKGVIIVAGVAVPPPVVDEPKPTPVPVKKPIPKGEKLEILFGDWVALVRHHSVHTHGNTHRVEITRTVQNRLWQEYNINSSPFHAQDIAKILPQL